MSDLIPKDQPLNEQKKIAEEILSEAFARDLITMDEFEKRVTVMHSAGSNRDVQNELSDLPNNLLVPRQSPEHNLPDQSKPDLLVLSSKTVKGNCLKKRQIKSRLILAEQKLDYTKTLLEPGKYYIDTKVILGSLTVIVPENYAVTVEMTPILAEIKERNVSPPSPGMPEIIIRGKVILGEVFVKTKGSGFIDKIKKLLED